MPSPEPRKTFNNQITVVVNIGKDGSAIPIVTSVPATTPDSDSSDDPFIDGDIVLPSVENDAGMRDSIMEETASPRRSRAQSSTRGNAPRFTDSEEHSQAPVHGYETRSTSRASSHAIMTPTSTRASSTDLYNATPRRSPQPFDMQGMTEALPARDTHSRNSSTSQNHLYSPTPDLDAQRSYLSVSPTPGHRRRRSSSRIVQDPHNVQDESPPSGRFHTPGFQKTFREAKNLMSGLTQVLAGGSLGLHNEPDSTMKKLHEEAEMLSRFSCPSTRTVGFVGDSGVGKSSLINCLLDLEGLAHTSNNGAACTCVITEYHYHALDSYLIEVEWFSREDITAQATNLYKIYRNYHRNKRNTPQNQQQSSEAQAQKEHKEEAEFAKDTFEAMFGTDRIDNGFDNWDFVWENDDENYVADCFEEFIENVYGGDDPDVPSSQEPGEVFDDVTSCSNRLMEFTAAAAVPNERALWPFIKKIKLSCNAHILSRGLILVDLPGLRDLNLARKRITERRVLKCDEIFVICSIGRAVTDEGVKNMFDLARQARLSNVGIVCTRSDDIQEAEAERDWHGANRTKLKSLSKDVESSKHEVDEINAEFETFEGLRYDELEKDEQVVMNSLNERSPVAKKLLAKHEFDLKSFLVETRNREVIKNLKKEYAHRIPDGYGQLQVFCVSKVIYWDNRGKPKDVAMPYLQLSQILDVRRHCISIVAASQLWAAERYINNSIPAFLGNLQLWIQSGSGSATAEKKERMRAVLTEVEDSLEQSLLNPRRLFGAENMKAQFREIIESKQISSLTEWSRAARGESVVWSRWHHASYSAFCRRHGTHTTPAAGYHNWNEEATSKMTDDLFPLWTNMLSIIRQGEDTTVARIQNCFDGAKAKLSRQTSELVDETAALRDVIGHQGSLLVFEIAAMYRDLTHQLTLLRTNALSGIHTGIFGTLMNASYDAANDEGGTGSDARRKAIIGGRVGDMSIFQQHADIFKNRFHQLANGFDEKLREKLAESAEIVGSSIDMLMNENVALESERDPQFRRIVEEEVKRIKRRLQSV